jgi:sugar lactone lactonase YvrE
MRQCIIWIVTIMIIGVTVPLTAPAPTARAQMGPGLQGVPLAQGLGALGALPRSCGGGLPPGAGAAACCLFGYVFFDGAPVQGARIVITNTSVAGSPSTEAWSEIGPDSAQPYFRLGMSGAPLQAQPGHTLSIFVEYSSHTYFMTHQVLSGPQQVDLVIPRDGPDDYTFERRIWSQPPTGTFNLNEPAVATDGAGLIYVADWGNSRVQVFQRDGTFVRTWGARGLAPGQMANPSGIAVSRDGVVYVADLGQQYIHRFTTTGEWLGSWRQQGTGPGQLGLMTDLAVDDVGNVYVTERRQDGVGRTRVQKFLPDGTFLTEWGFEGSGPGQLLAPGGLTVAGGVVYVADTENNRVVRFSTDGTYLGLLQAPGGAALSLNWPADVAVATDGTVYVSDEHNGRVIKLPAGGGALVELSGGVIWAHGLALDEQGDLYVGDSVSHEVVAFTSKGQRRTRWGSKGVADGRVIAPQGLALDAAGNVYVSDSDAETVKKFGPDGSLLATFGSPGGGDGQLLSPLGVALDSAGNLYVADSGNWRVMVFRPDGTYLRQWGSLGDGDGQFREPAGISIDGNDQVYVIDSGNHRLQRFTTQGALVWRLGGPAAGGGDGQFNYPRGVTVRADGVVYVADTDNHRIQVISAAGAYLSQIGTFGTGAGQFSMPSGVAFDSAGVLYVVEFNNYRFQRLSAAGAPLTMWGSAGTNPGTLNLPARIAVGADGRVYIAENLFGQVQVLRPTRYTRPIATITRVSAASVAPGGDVQLIGSGARSDGGSGGLSYEWLLNGSQSAFATQPQATLPAGLMRSGVNTVTLRVHTATEVSEDRTATIVLMGGNNSPHSWTFLLYLAGDNADLAPSLSASSSNGALARLLRRPAPANVSVVALYDGPGPNDSARYTIRPGTAVLTEALPEQRMDDPKTLVSFVLDGQQRAPADAYYLAIADHGNAIDGIAWDQTSDPNDHERLTNVDLRQAMLTITEQGARPIDILHLDACLMGLVEEAYQMRSLARYMIVSENLAWSAFAYDDYREAASSASNAANLAAMIVNRYALQVSALGLPYTLSALRVDQVDSVALRLDALAQELERYGLGGKANRTILAGLRLQVQKFDSGGNGSIDESDEYISLDHYAELVAAANLSSAITTRATELRTALKTFVLTSKVASGDMGGAFVPLANARGIAIYYPPRPGVRTYQTYRNELTFAADTAWDEFLQGSLASLAPLLPAQPNPVSPLPLPLRFNVYLPVLRR